MLLAKNLKISSNEEDNIVSDDDYDDESSGYDGGEFSQITMNNFLKDD